jgi:hypothetical protein
VSVLNPIGMDGKKEMKMYVNKKNCSFASIVWRSSLGAGLFVDSFDVGSKLCHAHGCNMVKNATAGNFGLKAGALILTRRRLEPTPNEVVNLNCFRL